MNKPACSRTAWAARRPRRCGFTIVELMVVLMILLLLIAILVPTIQKGYQTIVRVEALATIHLIDGGCRMYANDFGTFPPSRHPDYSDFSGKELLPLFLTGYGPDPGTKGVPFEDGARLDKDDGCDGFGFRLEKRGPVYGPYNGTEKIRTSGSDYQPGSPTGRPVFLDAFEQEVYYYRYDDDDGYNTADNADNADNATPPDKGYLDDAATMRGDFILVTAGPDGKFESFADNPQTDDVTNFLEER